MIIMNEGPKRCYEKSRTVSMAKQRRISGTVHETRMSNIFPRSYKDKGIVNVTTGH